MIPRDQMIEMTISKSSKVVEGLSGVTENMDVDQSFPGSFKAAFRP